MKTNDSKQGQHTPGPWHTTESITSVIGFFDREGYRVGSVDKFKTNGSILEAQANARLIAAAPELLNMLQRLLDEVMTSEAVFSRIDPLTLEHARAAIAKAQGQ